MNRSNYLKAFVIFIATNHFILLNGYRTEAWIVVLYDKLFESYVLWY